MKTLLLVILVSLCSCRTVLETTVAPDNKPAEGPRVTVNKTTININ